MKKKKKGKWIKVKPEFFSKGKWHKMGSVCYILNIEDYKHLVLKEER